MSKAWPPREDEILLKLAADLPAEKIAHIMGRRIRDVESRIVKLTAQPIARSWGKPGAPVSREFKDYWENDAVEGSAKLREALRPLLRAIAIRKSAEAKEAAA